MSATIKGAYLSGCVRRLTEKEGAEKAKRLLRKEGFRESYVDLFDYPIEECVLLHEYVVPLLYPGAPKEKALFEFGKHGFNIFAEGLIGKVAVTIMRGNLEGAVRKVSKYYSYSNRFGTVTSEKLGPKKHKVVFKGYRTPPEIQHGIITQACHKMALGAEVTLNVLSFEDDGQGRIFTDFEIFVEQRG